MQGQPVNTLRELDTLATFFYFLMSSCTLNPFWKDVYTFPEENETISVWTWSFSGIGNSTDHTELFNMASIPEEKYLYEFNDYDELNNLTLDVNYVQCKG